MKRSRNRNATQLHWYTFEFFDELTNYVDLLRDSTKTAINIINKMKRKYNKQVRKKKPTKKET